jgi:hypothetical protein
MNYLSYLDVNSNKQELSQLKNASIDYSYLYIVSTLATGSLKVANDMMHIRATRTSITFLKRKQVGLDQVFFFKIDCLETYGRLSQRNT